jgi:release factor glutamine methyltransferase
MVVESCAFGPIEIAFDERVLRPRDWTKLQAAWAAAAAAKAPPGPILELCAGAGHIGLLAALLSGRDLVQVDNDGAACAFARRNAEAAGLGSSVKVRHADLDVALDARERFPVILADPPYVRTADVARFPGDPRGAIDGGRDGMDVIRGCLDATRRHLESSGVCLLQLGGPAQIAAVTDLVDRLPRQLTIAESRVVDDDRAVALLRHAARRAPRLRVHETMT